MQPPRHLSVPAVPRPPRPPSLLPRAKLSPEAHSWRLPLRYPADPACGRPGEQGREGSGRGRRGRRLLLRARNTKRPARATCSHPARGARGTSWWRSYFSPQSSLPCLGLPCCLGRCPGKPRRASAAKAKAGGGARKDQSRARPLTRAPGSCPGPSRALSEADGRRQRPRRAGRRRECKEAESGGADPARPPGVGSACLSRSGSGAAPRLLAAFRAEGGRQTANRDPAGGLATRPTHLRAARPGRRCSCCAALAAPPRSALGARWRALQRTPPHQPTHPTPAQRAVARNVGAPPVTRGYAALFR